MSEPISQPLPLVDAATPSKGTPPIEETMRLTGRDLPIPPLAPKVAARADRLAAEDEAAKAARAQALEKKGRQDAAGDLWQDWGSRYRKCTFTNYIPKEDTQERALVEIQAYAARLEHYVKTGMGIVLTGEPGTGKDHLLACLATVALGLGITIKWTSGLRYFERVRDDIAEDARELVRTKAHTTPAVLIVSDPSWMEIPLTNNQRRTLGIIVDERSRNGRPTWVTVNANGRQEANRLLGKPLVDRLVDHALSLEVNGPSHRTSITTLLDDVGQLPGGPNG